MNVRFVTPTSLLVGLGMATALVLPGCDDDETGCRPEVPAGRIQGQVLSGGLAIDAKILATRLPDGNHLESIFETVPEKSGFYAIDVPEGRYILTLLVDGWYRTRYDYAAAELNYGQAEPDTLEVGYDNSPLTIDFVLGGLAVDVNLSPSLNGEWGEVRLHSRTLEPTGQWRTFVDQGAAEITDGHLAVQIAGILPNEYRVEVVLGIRHYLCDYPWDGEHVWYPGERDSTGTPWIPIAADSSVALSFDLPTEPARIEGVVTGAWLEPGCSGGPAISLFSPDSIMIMGRRAVGDDGGFDLCLHFAGPVRLKVSQRGVEQWIGGPAFGDATTYQLELGRTVSGIELKQCGVRFVGELIGPASSCLRIGFYDPDDLTLLATYRSNIAPSYPRSVSNLWPGEFLVYLSESYPGGTVWYPQWYDQASQPGDAQVITISAPGEIVVIPLVLARGGAIRGTVTMDPDTPRGCYVIVTPADDTKPWGYNYAWTRSRHFEVLGLPDGEFKIGTCPMDADYSWAWPDSPPAGTPWYPGSSTWEDAAVFTISDANEIEGIELVGE